MKDESDFAERMWATRPGALAPPRRGPILARVDIEDDPLVPLRYPIARVVDVRQPGEPEEDYAANWLREWMGAQ